MFQSQEYQSYFEKLAYGDQLDLSDLDKLFNWADLFPAHSELSEAKINVMKCKTTFKLHRVILKNGS